MSEQEERTTPGGAVRRGTGLRPLRTALPEHTTREIRRRGFFEVAVIRRWPSIVGSDIADCCAPDRITYPRGRRSGATLHLIVTSSRSIEVQHMEPVLLERINTVFGYDAVARLVLHHGLPEHVRPAARRRPALDGSEEHWIGELIGEVRHLPLREALRDLGRAVLAHGRQR